MAGALIVTASLAALDQSRFDALRQAHFPAARNQLKAHLTLFHAIPAVLEQELRHRLGALAAELAPPHATVSGLMNLGGGTAFRVVSDDLDAIRIELASAFHGHLTQQDSHGWRPHITVQNKVSASEARLLYDRLSSDFAPQPLNIAALAYDIYDGGPWLPGRRYPFRGR